MKAVNYFRQIKNMIVSSSGDSVFVLSDFASVAGADTVRKSVQRLKEEGLVKPLLRGVYVRVFNGKAVEPRPDAVANAIARNNGWTIVPKGDGALNLLGLTKFAPRKWAYASDGLYRKYSYGDVTVEFKKTTSRILSDISYKTALVIQALKSLGKGKVKTSEIEAIKDGLSADERKTLLSEAKCASSWIYEIIKKICG